MARTEHVDPGRRRIVIDVLGAPGMGKTTLVRGFWDAYPGPKKALDPSGDFADAVWPGYPDPSCTEHKPCGQWSLNPGGELHGYGCANCWLRTLIANGDGPRAGGWGPGLLLLDDADRYLMVSYQSPRKDPFRHLWLANRHVGLDVITVGHRASGMPKDLIGAASEHYFFAQDEPNAVDYLARIPSLKPHFIRRRDPDSGNLLPPRHPLPTMERPGMALHVRGSSVQMVEVFHVVPRAAQEKETDPKVQPLRENDQGEDSETGDLTAAGTLPRLPEAAQS